MDMMYRIVLSFLGSAVLLIACGNGADHTSQAAEGPAGRGADIYKAQCTLCHGEDGKLGIGGAKDLTTSTLTKEEMIAVITHGRGTMMPFNTLLSKDEIEAVADHVLNLGKSE